MWSGRPYGGGRNPGSDGGYRAKAVAVAAAAAVVVAAGVAGSLFLGGGRGERDDVGGGNGKASASAPRGATASVTASASASGGGAGKPTVPGWKVVVNPEFGTAFDVPPDWDVESPSLVIGFHDSKADYGDRKNWGKFLIAMSGTVIFRNDLCLSDSDQDGRVESTAVAVAGSKGAEGAEGTGDAALRQARAWVYAGYTQPDRKSIVSDRAAKPYTTRSGLKGSVAWARSVNTPQKDRCATDGKAVAFGFRNSAGGLAAWCLFGATGVKGELPDSTIRKILGTVRLHGKPTES
ncbi:hypothetical protein [Streptomyces sp. H51]|uniref:hypothetical protein n=1 Tax=Streptomyces sp. H51 TaxID=3111770 RepID=UPI002D79DCF5|nr:hypothetical protein [Streptomyces sp. H51]